jgi:hypothetical protein
MNRGVPPTALNARTGEFTPPGVTRCARSNQSADWLVAGAVTGLVKGSVEPTGWVVTGVVTGLVDGSLEGSVEPAGWGWEERTVPGTLAFSPTILSSENRPPSSAEMPAL